MALMIKEFEGFNFNNKNNKINMNKNTAPLKTVNKKVTNKKQFPIKK